MWCTMKIWIVITMHTRFQANPSRGLRIYKKSEKLFTRNFDRKFESAVTLALGAGAARAGCTMRIWMVIEIHSKFQANSSMDFRRRY